MPTIICFSLEKQLLHRPPLIAPRMDVLQRALIQLGILEPRAVVDAIEGIDVEVPEVMVPSREGVVAHDGEGGVRVDESEKVLDVFVDVAEHFVDVWLRGVGTLRAGVFEVEAVDFDDLVVVWVGCWRFLREEIAFSCSCSCGGCYRWQYDSMDSSSKQDADGAAGGLDAGDEKARKNETGEKHGKSGWGE